MIAFLYSFRVETYHIYSNAKRPSAISALHPPTHHLSLLLSQPPTISHYHHNHPPSVTFTITTTHYQSLLSSQPPTIGHFYHHNHPPSVTFIITTTHHQSLLSSQPQAVNGTLSRQRFRCLKKYIHFVDNQDLEKDGKYSKIRSIYDELNRQLLQFGIFSRDLSIDESMVPYYGNHSGKMFIKNKPVRLGTKTRFDHHPQDNVSPEWVSISQIIN